MGLCERDKFGLGLEGTKSGRWRVVWSVAKTSELGPLILKTLALKVFISLAMIDSCSLQQKRYFSRIRQGVLGYGEFHNLGGKIAY